MVFGEFYDCIYSAEGVGGDSIDNLNDSWKVELKHHACFGNAYSRLRNNRYSRVTYHVYLHTHNLKDKNYNLCSRLETKKILRCLQKTVPFSYNFTMGSFTKSSYGKENVDFYVLNITVEGNMCQHVWVTSMLRCFFEWPYNVAAKEACDLQSVVKKADGIDFSKINWINLYLTIASILGSTSLHGVVSFNQNPKLRNYKDWEQLFANSKANGAMGTVCNKGKALNRTIKSHRIYDQKTYDSEKDREIRVKKYVAAYKDKKSWKQ